MGRISVPPKSLLFMGILYAPNVALPELTQEISEYFGSVVLLSESFLFLETDYYYAEMGENISRVWIGFDRFVEPEKIIDIKHACNSMELNRYSFSGKRQVNLDPGYINLGKVVLASTKNNQHRLYLGQGIYGEVTLRYRKKRFEPWEWTYADYQRKEALQFFIQMRNILKQHLKQL